MEEKDTNPELTSFLNKPLEKKKRTFTTAFKEDIEETPVRVPLKPNTKKEILYFASQLTKTDPAKYIPFLEKINDMSDDEAQTYLECLKASLCTETYGALTTRVIEFLADVIVHPSDIDTKIEMLNDKTLESLISSEVGSILLKAGKAAIVLLLAFYGGTSWARTRLQLFERVTPAPTPLQNDGMREEQIGEIDPDGEANVSDVDKNVQ